MKPTMQQAVQSGAEFLDETLPLWYKRIDIDRWRKDHRGGDPLSQIFHTFYAGYHYLGISSQQACVLGFGVTYNSIEEYKDSAGVSLDKAQSRLIKFWVQEIKKREA